MTRIFLLSPADCSGLRARRLIDGRSASELAARLRSPGRATIAEVFAFLSALYFRGKLTYARRFARPPRRPSRLVGPGVLVITPTMGLVRADRPIGTRELRAFAEGGIDAANPAYRRPLEASAWKLWSTLGRDADTVLLGSIASPKYVDVLVGVFGERLLFPADFVGRGDMSRGGLLLRSVEDGDELDYAPIAGAVRHGTRPPKLAPRRARRLQG